MHANSSVPGSLTLIARPPTLRLPVPVSLDRNEPRLVGKTFPEALWSFSMPSRARRTAGDAVTVAPASCRKSPAWRDNCLARRMGVSRSVCADDCDCDCARVVGVDLSGPPTGVGGGGLLLELSAADSRERSAFAVSV